jgi:dihydrofolate reductase
MPVSVFIGTSLDGFIARPDGGLDFLPTDGGEPHGYDEFMADIDAIVIGRGTFDTVMGFDRWPYGGRRVVALSSHTLVLPTGIETVEQMSGNPPDVVARLAQRGMHNLYVDGGITIQRFLEAGLVDRLIVTRVPVLIGQGIPLFGKLSRDIALEHLTTHAYKSGLVKSEYRVMN